MSVVSGGDQGPRRDTREEVDRGVRTIEVTAELVGEALAAKPQTTVSVCIPCRNEASTIGPIVSTIVRSLMNADDALVDEVLVFDDGSADATAAEAVAAGARIVNVGGRVGVGGSGKGNVLWESVAASTGDIVCWVDGDLLAFDADYVRRLVVPLLAVREVSFVKGFYERPLDANGLGGGRNTELVARPALALLFPELAAIRQPLGGEYAARRDLLERLTFPAGYGVEIGLLIDAARLLGPGAIGQVDLGVRRHRSRPLAALSAQAAEILHALLARVDDLPSQLAQSSATLRVGEHDVALRLDERPPRRVG